MTAPTVSQNYALSVGTSTNAVSVPIVSSSNPSSFARGSIYPVGKWWINESTNTGYLLTSYTTSGGVTTANWSAGGLSSGSSLTVGPITSTGDVTITRSQNGGAVRLDVINTSNTANSVALISAETAGASAGDAVYVASVSGAGAYIWGVDNSDSDAFVISSGTSLGTSNVLRISSTGAVSIPLGDLTVSRSASGSAVTSTFANTANAASSSSVVAVSVGGASAADAFAQFIVTGVQTWSLGVDNSASDAFVLAASNALGTSNQLSVTTAGVATFSGNTVALSSGNSGQANQLSVTNGSDTADSTAVVSAAVGGTSAGDAWYQATVVGGQTWSWGVDNSDSDAWVLSNDVVLGSNNMLRIAPTTGNAVFTGTVTAPQLFASGDSAGAASTISLTNANSTTIGAGTGTVKMSSANNADSAVWIKVYVGATAYWIPGWTTNSP